MSKGKSRASIGKNNKRKGNQAEREYAKFFREFGFPFCKTTREANRLLDGCGVDLAFLPFNIQVKAGVHRGLKYADTLKYIEDRLKELYPPEAPEHDMPKLLIRKLPVGRGNTKTEYHETVTLTMNDFVKLFKLIENGSIQRNKS